MVVGDDDLFKGIQPREHLGPETGELISIKIELSQVGHPIEGSIFSVAQIVVGED